MTTANEWSVSGLCVMTRPERLAEIEELIAGRDGFEVHARDPQTGKLVVVQERVSVDEHRRGLRELHALPGVLTAPTGSTTTKAIKCPPYRGSSSCR